ncbi:hypothetical protein SAMN05421736_11613 [Evansella caseinilytica]|uniref:Lipoprotein n=1 Tax=Evansella caseinilytica TaxID=1503961 RepID=A0A1H3TTR7_9BACI|nr:hypothetical protein [Evansella caseinilytica]SDZ53211.1 hypothetical protein SAMN05421736_11613 [Evansella caseinilytica]
MNKLVSYFLLIVSCLVIAGCQESNELKRKKVSEEVNEPKVMERFDEEKLSQVDIFDFEHIEKAPETTEKQPLSKAIKLYFSNNDTDTNDAIAIDIENNQILVEPWMSALGVNTVEEPINSNDLKNVVNILEKYDVQNWERDYSKEDPSTYEDGYGWHLWIQFEDGTVEKHKGSGVRKEVIPDNFDDFVKELNEFVNERLDDH